VRVSVCRRLMCAFPGDGTLEQIYCLRDNQFQMVIFKYANIKMILNFNLLVLWDTLFEFSSVSAVFFIKYLQIHANEYARHIIAKVTDLSVFIVFIVYLVLKSEWARVALFRFLTRATMWPFCSSFSRAHRVWSRARGRSIPNFIAAFSRPWLWTIFFYFTARCILLPCAISRSYSPNGGLHPSDKPRVCTHIDIHKWRFDVYRWQTNDAPWK